MNNVMCAWCPTFDRTNPANAHASHGICPTCAALLVTRASQPRRAPRPAWYLVALLSLLLVTSACSQADHLLMPAPADVVVSAPTGVTVTTAGPATAAHEALLNLFVSDAVGKGVAGQVVTLTTTAGTFDHARVVTSQGGTAQAILTTSTDASVTATSGAFSATVQVEKFFVAPPPEQPVYVAPPPPPAPIIVAPVVAPTPTPTLVATLTCTPLPHTNPTPCNVNVSYDGVPLPATAITGILWNWGDGASNTTTSPVTTHPYVNTGTYHLFADVTAMTSGGSKTTTTTATLIIP